MQKPRVAPKNIQFEEAIQIREIPRKSEVLSPTNLVQRRGSWDPNLANVICFSITILFKLNFVF